VADVEEDSFDLDWLHHVPLPKQLAIIYAAVVGDKVCGYHTEILNDMNGLYSFVFSHMYAYLGKNGYFVCDPKQNDADSRRELLVKYKAIHELTCSVVCGACLNARIVWQALEMQDHQEGDPPLILPNRVRPIVLCINDNIDTLTDVQRVVRHVELEALRLGLRRNGSIVMRKVVATNSSGVTCQTHAWEPMPHGKDIMQMDAFVNEACREDMHATVYHALTKNANTWKHASERLSSDHTRHLFPQVELDRTVFAFANGTYMTWVEGSEGTYHDRFYPYNQDGTSPLPESVTAANFFPIDLPFDQWSKGDWRNIPTPNLDKVLDVQEFTQEVRAWCFVNLGRMVYEVGQHDNWQVIPFLKGKGGCGKSTIINEVVGRFYHATHTGILSNNVQAQFALASIYTCKKLLFCAPEIKADWKLEQAEFQSMVSGELLGVNIKHQEAAEVKWRVPGILGGNEVPGWIDNSGSIARRVMIFDFVKAVPKDKCDTRLSQKLAGEMAAILMKCTRAYHEAVARVGDDNIWNHLPKYFEDKQTELRISCNSLEHFLVNDPRLQRGEGMYTSRDAFLEAYKQHCRSAQLQVKPFISDNYRDTFDRYGLSVSRPEQRMYPKGAGTVYKTAWVLGIDVVDSECCAMEGDGF
jgi:hypothetical protein